MAISVYVRIRFKTAQGNVTWWAQKLGRNSYRKVNREGDYGFNGKDHRLLLTAKDIIFEHVAIYSQKYGVLETDKIKA